MLLTFANPAGFWALLGVPAILAIHFLQRESRRVVTSTLFLFEVLSPVSAQGRRFERLRGSVPLALQLAAVALLTWLLVGPRWLRKDSTQRVVVVLDSSVSMSAFRPELARALATRLHALAPAAARTEWRLIESDPTRPTLYAGNDLGPLLATLPAWNPRLGTHDFQPALNTARSLVRDAGVALFATDRPTPLPEGVELLAVGRPIENCGWIGVTVEGGTWRALVRNHSAAPQTRTWHLEAAGAASPDTALTLAPGQTLTLSGPFPPGQDRCELVLSPDAFPLDDRLPIVRPAPKKLTLAVKPGTPLDPFFHRLAASVPEADTVPTHADARLAVAAADPPPGPAILFVPPEAATPAYLPGELITEDHPLTSGLNWNGLLCKDTAPLPAREGDEVLLWQGTRPLLFLRGGRADRSLVVNFDLRQSNADRLPAFVVLLERFLESVRAEKVAFERLNVDTNQLLEVAGDPAGPLPHVTPDGDGPPRAPAAPGFLEVAQGNRPLLAAAAHFSDAREADFRDAASADTLKGKTAHLAERNSQQDVLWPVCALLLGAVCLANWALTGGGGAP